MPSLSIVIPYRQNDLRLEATLLSVLENRPHDCEVIVVHDGSYRDPYQLGDEVVFVEAERGCGTVGLFNAGCLAACSPVVNTLLDGTTVQSEWSETACREINQNATLAAVACPISRSRASTYGLDLLNAFEASALRAGRFANESRANECAGPELECGFFRRKVLMALGGFNESLEVVAAGVEFAWAIDELELDCRCDCTSSRVNTPLQSRPISHADLQQLASLAVAYELADAGFGAAVTELARGCMAGNPVASYAWFSGLRSIPRHSPAVRLALAREHLAQHGNTIHPFTDTAPSYPRRAA